MLLPQSTTEQHAPVPSSPMYTTPILYLPQPIRLTSSTQYEDIKTDLTNPTGSIPVPYQNLAYSSSIRVRGNLASALSEPHSPLNYASFSFVGTTTADSFISTIYSNSNATSFDLKSFYLGCTLATAGASLSGTACTVGLYGQLANGGPFVGPFAC